MKAIAAPKDAPEEIPKMYGSQMGFLKIDWKVAPLMASALPATMLIQIRGRRKFHIVIA